MKFDLYLLDKLDLIQKLHLPKYMRQQYSY